MTSWLTNPQTNPQRTSRAIVIGITIGALCMAFFAAGYKYGARDERRAFGFRYKTQVEALPRCVNP